MACEATIMARLRPIKKLMQSAVVSFVAVLTTMRGREVPFTLSLFESCKGTGSSIGMQAGVARGMHVWYSFRAASFVTLGQDKMVINSIPIFGYAVNTNRALVTAGAQYRRSREELRQPVFCA